MRAASQTAMQRVLSEGPNRIGGLVGWNNEGSITNSYATSSVSEGLGA